MNKSDSENPGLQGKDFSYCESHRSMQNLNCLASLLAHGWVLLGDPLDGPPGVVPRSFDPFHVKIFVGTLDT